jgi:hypothetical protein
MKRIAGLAAAVLVLAGCESEGTGVDVEFSSAADSAVAINQTRLYEVAIENLTTGQPFSPGVMLTHTAQVNLFTVGQPASEGVKEIAEAGNEAPAAQALDGRPGVGNLMRIETPTPPMNFPKPNANRTKVRITAPPGVDRLSLAVMLTCTNDGFTGLNAVRLPFGFDLVAFTEKAYDARAEVNNEQSPFIVPGCSAFGPALLPVDGNRKAPESGAIVEHPGIRGVGDLRPEVVAWQGPVLRVTVQRLRVDAP